MSDGSPAIAQQSDMDAMRLEAEARGCWGTRFALRLDGSPWGDVVGRGFGEGAEVRLLGRRRLTFKRQGFLRATYRLVDEDGTQLGAGWQGGWVGTRWTVQLSCAEGTLVSAGVFNTGFRLLIEGVQVASAGEIGWCSRGWWVQGGSPLDACDLLMVGLVYNTILNHRRAAAAAT